MASASAGGHALEGMHDPRLRPRLLRALLDGCLPLPDADDMDLMRPRPSPADLAFAADAVRTHGLLAEERDGVTAVLEEWRAAVDSWVDRLLELVGSGKEYSCWVGTSFLGLTIQECCDGRFVNSYQHWFEKLLKKMKTPSGIKMVSMFMCTTMSDLFVRLATFENLKDEASSLARKVVKPLLSLLDENGPVAEKAVDLLGLLMKLFPSSVYRHFNTVESVITAKIMNGQCNLQESKKLASTLALLPCVRPSNKRMLLMIQKILVVVNSMLNDTFPGLKEEYNDHELMALLTPAESELVLPLGGQTTYGDGEIHPTKKLCSYVVPTISALIHCCSVMLTCSYPDQVTDIPVRALVTLIQKALLIDGSLHESLLQPDALFFHQEFTCSGIPTLHLTFLDLLASTIKGMRSSLIPHADIVVMPVAEYFKRAKLSATRRKLYTIVQLLLGSMGSGMASRFLQFVISNIFADLGHNSGSSSDTTSNSQVMAPLSVRIAALETLEVLLNLGSSLRPCYWTAEMDMRLITIARNARDKAEMCEEGPVGTEDPSVSDFQLASYKALLASFLSNPDGRHSYALLKRGIELFTQGKLGADTELAKFCSHALLALDALILHPRQLPQQNISKGVAHNDLGLRSAAPEPQCSVRKRKRPDMRDKCEKQIASIAEEPTHALAKDSTVEKHAPVEVSTGLSVQEDARQPHAITGQNSEATTHCLLQEVQAAPASSTAVVEMADGLCSNVADFDPLGNLPGSSSVHPASTSVNAPESNNPGAEISNEMSGYQCRILSGDASSSQNVPVPRLPTIAAATEFGSEWDSLEPLLDIGDPDADLNFCSDLVGDPDHDFDPDAGLSLDFVDPDTDLNQDDGMSLVIVAPHPDFNPDAGLSLVTHDPDPDLNPENARLS